jgi:hypothetical protein
MMMQSHDDVNSWMSETEVNSWGSSIADGFLLKTFGRTLYLEVTISIFYAVVPTLSFY